MTAMQHQLDVVAHSNRMIAAAMDQVADANEAHWLVHCVMLRAMTGVSEPVSRRDLDTALGHAMRERSEAMS